MNSRLLLSTPLLAMAFRPFFLAAAAHAVIAIVVWAAFLIYGAMPNGVLPEPFLWHGHTMIGGFAGAVIAGFLLTASANWTGRKTTTPLTLLIIIALWLLGRLVDYLPAMPAWIGLFADGAFWLLLTILVLRVIVVAGNWRNIGFAVLPLAFGLVDFAWHLEDAGLTVGTARPALWLGIDLLTLIMGAMGGRIIPLFTGRRLQSVVIRNPTGLAIATNAALVTVVPVNLFFRGEPIAAWIMSVAGVLLFARLAGWNSKATRYEPMLWVLHLGFFWLGIALVLRAVAVQTGVFLEATALHAITVGALGALSMGMLTRVSFGHTGRAIVADRSLVIAFTLVSLAAVARLTSLFSALTWLAFGASSCLWAIAFAICVWKLVPILVKPSATPS